MSFLGNQYLILVHRTVNEIKIRPHRQDDRTFGRSENYLLPLKLRTVLEPENQSAISICRDVIQQTAPEVLSEF